MYSQIKSRLRGPQGPQGPQGPPGTMTQNLREILSISPQGIADNFQTITLTTISGDISGTNLLSGQGVMLHSTPYQTHVTPGLISLLSPVADTFSGMVLENYVGTSETISYSTSGFALGHGEEENGVLSKAVELTLDYQQDASHNLLHEYWSLRSDNSLTSTSVPLKMFQPLHVVAPSSACYATVSATYQEVEPSEVLMDFHSDANYVSLGLNDDHVTSMCALNTNNDFTVTAPTIQFNGQAEFTTPPHAPDPILGNDVATKGYVDTIVGNYGGNGLSLYFNDPVPYPIDPSNAPVTGTLQKTLVPMSSPSIEFYTIISDAPGTNEIARFVTDIGFPNLDILPTGLWSMLIYGYCSGTEGGLYYHFTLNEVDENGNYLATIIPTSGDSSDVNTVSSSDPDAYHCSASLVTEYEMVSKSSRIQIIIYATGDQVPSGTTLRTLFGGKYYSFISSSLSGGTSILTTSNIWTGVNHFQLPVTGETAATGTTTDTFATCAFVHAEMTSTGFITQLPADRTTHVATCDFVTSALDNYVTVADVSANYVPYPSLDAYVRTVDASNTYLRILDASAYLRSQEASTTYAPLASYGFLDASNTWLAPQTCDTFYTTNLYGIDALTIGSAGATTSMVGTVRLGTSLNDSVTLGGNASTVSVEGNVNLVTVSGTLTIGGNGTTVNMGTYMTPTYASLPTVNAIGYSYKLPYLATEYSLVPGGYVQAVNTTLARGVWLVQGSSRIKITNETDMTRYMVEIITGGTATEYMAVSGGTVMGRNVSKMPLGGGVSIYAPCSAVISNTVPTKLYVQYFVDFSVSTMSLPVGEDFNLWFATRLA